MKNNKLIIYELNEVPKKIILDFIKKRPNSTISKIIKEGIFLDTYTTDEEELHPWSTWPTVYRGVNNKLHNIKYINQDLTLANKKYPPIWDILNQNNIDIGIFGTLQSFPPKTTKNYSFYVPDTFSPEIFTHPSYLNSFQAFNLQLAKENKAKSKGISLSAFYLFWKLIINKNVGLLTVIKIIRHLINEILNKNFKKRRSFIQTILGFDLYLKLINKYKPSFTTFFTNHVASTMHRYWKDTYPSEFEDSVNINSFDSNSILYAMDLVDNQITKLYQYSKINNSYLWIISSMGQKAIDRGSYIPETILTDFENLINSLNLQVQDYKLLPAMQPDICIKCNNLFAQNKIKNTIKELIDLDKKQILIVRYEPNSLSINLSISTTNILSETKKVSFKNKIYDLEKFGLNILERDQGTAYHSRDGILISNKKINDLKTLNQNKIDTRNISNLILNLFKLKVPKYMMTRNEKK